MAMIDLAVFYDTHNWTRLFWEENSAYTIAPGRHIGTDITTRGEPKRVPALLPGYVVNIADTDNIGHVITIDVSESGSQHKYLSYCHMSGYDLPQLGSYLRQGDLFGKIATGPKSLGPSHPNYPGSSWNGAHLHLVWHNKPYGAFRLGQNDRYGNPEDLIRNILSTPAGLNPVPFDPEEEDEMAIPSVITVGVPTGGAGSPNQYWSMNLADHTIALLRNGDQLNFRKALGVPEYINQAPAILAGYRRIDQA